MASETSTQEFLQEWYSFWDNLQKLIRQRTEGDILLDEDKFDDVLTKVVEDLQSEAAVKLIKSELSGMEAPSEDNLRFSLAIEFVDVDESRDRTTESEEPINYITTEMEMFNERVARETEVVTTINEQVVGEVGFSNVYNEERYDQRVDQAKTVKGSIEKYLPTNKWMDGLLDIMNELLDLV